LSTTSSSFSRKNSIFCLIFGKKIKTYIGPWFYVKHHVFGLIQSSFMYAKIHSPSILDFGGRYIHRFLWF
jgi:hypothetical protein